MSELQELKCLVKASKRRMYTYLVPEDEYSNFHTKVIIAIKYAIYIPCRYVHV
jgi:hypothetical protein